MIELDLSELQIENVITYLSDFITESRLERLQSVLNQRTRHITVVLEDIYQPHNASAVIRSCDGFGIQDLHIIENDNRFSVSKGVTIGSDKWITKYRYNENGNNTVRCIKSLKDQGYQIVAASPHETDIVIQDLDITEKTALLFGTELEGLSKRALEMADKNVSIPMYGFSESFNISVSVAICLSHLSHKIRQQQIQWKLNEIEKQNVLLQWIINSVKEPELLIKRYMEHMK